MWCSVSSTSSRSQVQNGSLDVHQSTGQPKVRPCSRQLFDLQTASIMNDAQSEKILPKGQSIMTRQRDVNETPLIILKQEPDTEEQ